MPSRNYLEIYSRSMGEDYITKERRGGERGERRGDDKRSGEERR